MSLATLIPKKSSERIALLFVALIILGSGSFFLNDHIQKQKTLDGIESQWQQADIFRKQKDFEKSLSIYNDVFGMISSNDYPVEYGKNHYQRGRTYYDLSFYENTSVNIRNSLSAYDQALYFFDAKKTPREYSLIMYYMGDSFLKLYAVTNEEDDLDLAIDAYEKSLEYYSIASDPLYFASVNNKLGNAYRKRGNSARNPNDLLISIEFYHESLRVFREDVYPVEYGGVQNNLGNVYLELSKYEDGEESINDEIKDAIIAYNKALDVFTVESRPMEYATVKNNLGNAYFELSKLEDKESNIELSVSSYHAALAVFTVDKYPVAHDGVIKNIARAYKSL